MNQILHIFKKDARHLWIEIAISLALVAYMVAVGHVAWTVQGPFRSPSDAVWRTILEFLTPLIEISWLLLVARVIHSEALVGDRQFWFTRPYEWKKLMAAKLLFLATFIYLPFILMQVILLARAGFSPMHWFLEMMLNLVFFSALILALSALATVTPNFGRILVILLGLVVCIFVIFAGAVLGGIGVEVTPLGSSRPVASYLMDAIALALGGAVIVSQYRARRTKMAWALLLAIPVAFAAIQFINPDGFLMNHSYPPLANASGAPVQLAYDDTSGDNSLEGHETRGMNTAEKMITIHLTVHLSGVADGRAILFNEARISLEAANGEHWTSGWQGQSQWVLRPENDLWEAEMVVPTRVFEKFQATPVNMRLSLALTELKAGSGTQIAMPEPTKEIAIPGFGICAPEPLGQRDAVTFSCRFAWQPPFTYVSTRWFSQPCAAAKSANDPGIGGYGWVGSVNTTEDWRFFPVVSPYIRLSNSEAYKRGGPELRYLCPDAPATFTHYEPVRRVQESLTIPNIRLWVVN